MSCDPQESGCNGGSPVRTLYWVKNNMGLTTTDQYPYLSGDTGVTGSCLPGYSVDTLSAPSSIVAVTPKSDTALEAAININPVVIYLEADSLVFQLYVGGIINTASCGGATLNHAITAVGYGTDANGIRFIKARNQWGSYWYNLLLI